MSKTIFNVSLLCLCLGKVRYWTYPSFFLWCCDIMFLYNRKQKLLLPVFINKHKTWKNIYSPTGENNVIQINICGWQGY